MKTEDFFDVHQTTFVDFSCWSMYFKDISCICFMFLTISAIHWNKFDTHCMYIFAFNKQESNFCRFYQNESWKTFRIIYHSDCFLRSFWLQSHVENFLHMLWWCSGYILCSPRSALSSILWILVIQRLENIRHPYLKKLSPHLPFESYFSL